MAMNKSEKQMVEKLHTRLALRFTPIADGPDLYPPKNSYGDDNLTFGYSIVGSSTSVRVCESCSNTSSHSNSSRDRAYSRGGIMQFSTKVLALKYLRNILENEFAKRLREVDILIEKELGGGE